MNRQTFAALHISRVWSPLSSVVDIGTGGAGGCGGESLLTLETHSSPLNTNITTTRWKLRHATVNCIEEIGHSASERSKQTDSQMTTIDIWF